MTDYISKGAAIVSIMSVPEGNWGNLRYAKEINSIPAADVRPVVCCKDCDLWNRWNKTGRESLGTLRCSCAEWSGEGYTVYTAPNDFCSHGERMDGGETE